MRSSRIRPVSWSISYLFRDPCGISTTTSTSIAGSSGGGCCLRLAEFGAVRRVGVPRLPFLERGSDPEHRHVVVGLPTIDRPVGTPSLDRPDGTLITGH